MRAVTYPAYSTDLSTLRVEELPRPKLAPSAVLIEVRAASVNPVPANRSKATEVTATPAARARSKSSRP